MEAAKCDPDPAQVVELEVGGIAKIDVGRIHVALAQQAARGSAGITLGDQVAALRDDLRHRSYCAHAPQAATAGGLPSGRVVCRHGNLVR